jgi:hypothetical protein
MQQSMIQQLIFALALTSVTVVLHAVGTVHVVIPASGVWKAANASPIGHRAAWILIQLVSMLLVLHVLEMAVCAAAFADGNVLPDFETSLYYSLTSCATVGYGDVIPTAPLDLWEFAWAIELPLNTKG